MKKIAKLKMWLLMSVFMVAMVSTAAGRTIYVDDDASVGGNGQSWGTAYKYLQDGLATAVSGDEIWVAAGTYKPDQVAANPGGTGSRYATFQLKNSVALYGGFAGNETSLYQRDWQTNETILSGDIGTAGVNTDNSRHVVTGSGTDDTAVLDGFTIMGGYADGWPGGGGMLNRGGSPTLGNCVFSANWTNRSGGGMCNNNNSSPTLANCKFSANWADQKGGGMYNNEDSSPTLTNCMFIGNSANDGGGIYNMHRSSSTLANCTFTGNSAVRWGGGMCGDWAGDSTLTECTFSENDSGWEGGGMYNGIGSPTLTGCTFVGNSAVNGGGMFNRDPVGPTLTNCTFSENSATGSGGGMGSCRGANPKLINCTFSRNSAIEDGGGMRNGRETSPTLIGCTFSANSARRGGGMQNEGYGEIGASPTLTNCTFSENSATEHGGGIYNEDHSSPILSNCTFSENSAVDAGGGMYNCWDTSTKLTNCTFSDNSAGDGGGMRNHYCNPMLTNCTFTGNRAEVEGGGGMTNNFSSPTITNCMFSGNSANEKGGGMQAWYWTARLTNCVFVGNIAEEGGGMYSERGDGLIVNCTFSQNYASWRGGGMRNRDSDCPYLTNCILWGDTPDEISGGPPDITYSDVEGGWSDTGNINADPLFADADLRLSAGSPCIDAGDNSAVLVGTDLDGNQRIVNGIVDMGAYEAALLDPVELVLVLMQDVIDLDLHQGIENGLVSKLEAAIDSLNRGQDKAARNQLNAFINLVEAQRGKQISETDADALIAAALDIIELLSTG